ncbi:MAG TPA: sulfotransferase, partial [Rhizomicrobium sp.]
MIRHPQLRKAAAFLESNQPASATKLLREYLKQHPRDPSALHLMAETAARQGRHGEAEMLLAQCVELAPELIVARFAYANALLNVNKPEAALREGEYLLKREPGNPLFRVVKAISLESIAEHAASAALWRDLVHQYPERSVWWVRYGHVLRALDLPDECISAYRKALQLDPSSGDAWWGLADLKTFRFGKAEIDAMEDSLARDGVPTEDRTRLHFSLGKAYADIGIYERSFDHYAKGNALRRLGIKHDPDVLSAHVARCKSFFTADLFRTRRDSGCSSREPIFLVGMPRSGSTLIEQILASHSQIEGTRELADLASQSMELQRMAAQEGIGYPEVLGKLDAAALKRQGERYLESTRVHRKLGRAFFIDKMGSNFVHVGFLQLILPNARIVDVRRDPLACCFSNFAQLFPTGQNNAYRMTDIARHYRDYLELMDHFDRVLPGKVHRILYEDLIAAPETEIRRMLDFLDLSFEPQCLEFHKTGRVVTTASSEQVRSPIYKDALEQWRHYERWLQPLKSALGPALAIWAGVR